LLGNHHETGGDDLVLELNAVTNEEILHGSMPVITTRVLIGS
jgi:hypothetical protein